VLTRQQTSVWLVTPPRYTSGQCPRSRNKDPAPCQARVSQSRCLAVSPPQTRRIDDLQVLCGKRNWLPSIRTERGRGTKEAFHNPYACLLIHHSRQNFLSRTDKDQDGVVFLWRCAPVCARVG